MQMINSTNYLLFSVHPRWLHLIENKEKSIEFRRSYLGPSTGWALLYGTSPLKKITCRVEFRAIKAKKLELLRYLPMARCSESEFEDYFFERSYGYALLLSQISILQKPITLDEMKRYKITPPQNFSYVDCSKISELK